MIKRFMAVMVAMVLGLTGGALVASPAQATYSDCGAYNEVVCFHQHSNFTGQVWRQQPGEFPTGCRNFAPAAFNNEASTAFNRTSQYLLRIYTGSNCTGSYVSLQQGEIQAFNQTNTWMNDQGSSAKIIYVG